MFTCFPSYQDSSFFNANFQLLFELSTGKIIDRFYKLTIDRIQSHQRQTDRIRSMWRSCRKNAHAISTETRGSNFRLLVVEGSISIEDENQPGNEEKEEIFLLTLVE
jgi:hypothetical protein